MKLADYIVDYIASTGTKHVFLVTGGAIAHVVDAAFRRSSVKKDIECVCVQHEQAGAMAAEAYSRLGPGLGVVLTTSGPGATNLITGICGCWFDSIPALFITGQVGTAESCGAVATKPRQVGFQEADIVNMVASITKFAAKVTDPATIKYVLEKAVSMAKGGRPGPVLLDIPVDVQFADIDPSKLVGFDPEKEREEEDRKGAREDMEKKVGQVIALIEKAERPIILFGGGVKLAHAEKVALAFAETLRMPIVVSWSGFDTISHDHPQFVGHIGVYGSRGANFAVQNADLVLSLGSRLDTRQTGGRVNAFARGAKKVMVDIDRNEIMKGRGLAIDVGIAADVGEFLRIIEPRLSGIRTQDVSAWRARTAEWKNKYPAVLPEYYAQKDTVSAYVFLKMLSDALPEGATTVVDEGGNLVWTMQSFEVKKGQRLISTFGNSPMGYALPAAIGASFALGKKPVVCIDGDGGFQPNIQELQTVKHYNVPLKIFIMNNRSMGIIKQFQDLYFDARHYATTEEHGYSARDFAAVATAYGIEAITIRTCGEMEDGIQRALAAAGPVLCNVLINENQQLNPKLEFGRPLEDMAPYLERQEFFANMIVEPLAESKEMPKRTGWQTLK